MDESNKKEADQVEYNNLKNSKSDEIDQLKFEINYFISTKIISNIFSFVSFVLLFCFSLIQILLKFGISIEKLLENFGIQVSGSDSSLITQIYKIAPFAIFFFGSIVAALVYYRIKNSVSNKNNKKEFEYKKLMLSKLISEKKELESSISYLNEKTDSKIEKIEENIIESGVKQNLPLIHGSVSQQWLAVVILQIAPSFSLFILSILSKSTFSEFSIPFIIFFNAIAFPLILIASAFNNFLSKVLVSFTSTRTWLLTNLIAGNIYVGLVYLIVAFIYAADTKFSFENIYSFNAAMVLFGYIATLFITLFIGGRIVWRRQNVDIVKAIIIPFAFSATIIILSYFFAKNKTQNMLGKSKISQESSNNSYKPTPESQFLNFQKSRMGPSYDVLNVVMNVKKVEGSRVTYSGFYTYKINGTSHEDVSFFTAVFENGQFQGWLPNR